MTAAPSPFPTARGDGCDQDPTHSLNGTPMLLLSHLVTNGYEAHTAEVATTVCTSCAEHLSGAFWEPIAMFKRREKPSGRDTDDGWTECDECGHDFGVQHHSVVGHNWSVRSADHPRLPTLVRPRIAVRLCTGCFRTFTEELVNPTAVRDRILNREH